MTECLVVVATVAFLLVLPGLAANRELINRAVCLNNLRQMGTGSQLYAAEDPKGRLTGSLPSVSSPTSPPGDDLNWLYGYGPSRSRYIQDLKTFVCPATQNYTRTNELRLPSLNASVLVDLYDNGQTVTSPGHSYEVLSWFGTTAPKTLQSTATYVKARNPLIGAIPVPSRILLMHDAMEPGPNPGSLNNYPNPYSGHGIEGGNMLFADGHAEWIATKDWSYRFAVGNDLSL